MPFNNADLWGLYQYFYSPPVQTSEESSVNTPTEIGSAPGKVSKSSSPSKSGDCANIHERPELEANTRPCKKQVNKFTVSRISNYSKIKVSKRFLLLFVKISLVILFSFHDYRLCWKSINRISMKRNLY
jgi:hypothetical protein